MGLKRFLFYTVILLSICCCKKENVSTPSSSQANKEVSPYIQEVTNTSSSSSYSDNRLSSSQSTNNQAVSHTKVSATKPQSGSRQAKPYIVTTPSQVATQAPVREVVVPPQNDVPSFEHSSFRLEVFASQGGTARFLEGEELSKNLGTDCYEAIATANEGYYFDHWELIQGRPITPVTMAKIMVQGFSGTALKAHFIKASELIYVSRQIINHDQESQGSRVYPYHSIDLAVSEAKKRILSNETNRVELRVAVGDYLLKDHAALELIPGISIIGGFNQESWELLVGNKAAKTTIRVSRGFSPSAMIFINSGEQDSMSYRHGRVTLAGLVIDGSLAPVVLVSANGVTPRITQCVLKGYGEALVSCFDSGAEIDTNQFLSFSNSGVVLDISPLAKQNVNIAQNSILIGSQQRPLAQGIGIRVTSPENSQLVKVRVANNQIKASVSKSFTGIKIDNSFMLCEGNRIETINKSSELSKGMELQGEAVINGNTILLESNEGYGVSLMGNGYSGRILNNTIMTSSADVSRPMTACGEIVGANLLVSHNLFVNPEGESAAALGTGVLHVGNRIYNNCIISNNAEEKRLVVGVNGNVDKLYDDSIKYAINKGAIEIAPQF